MRTFSSDFFWLGLYQSLTLNLLSTPTTHQNIFLGPSRLHAKHNPSCKAFYEFFWLIFILNSLFGVIGIMKKKLLPSTKFSRMNKRCLWFPKRFKKVSKVPTNSSFCCCYICRFWPCTILIWICTMQTIISTESMIENI